MNGLDQQQDPNKCDCQEWAYDDHINTIWPSLYCDGEMIFIGHHPSCKYYTLPPADMPKKGLATVEDFETAVKIIKSLVNLETERLKK